MMNVKITVNDNLFEASGDFKIDGAFIGDLFLPWLQAVDGLGLASATAMLHQIVARLEAMEMANTATKALLDRRPSASRRASRRSAWRRRTNQLHLRRREHHRTAEPRSHAA